ncbi:MAG TPA: hypothetical protein DCG48_03955 [Rhodospirillaceae bacterium]|nr:hypothetical protein [Rhodospirillaceae bacterium]|tara:strand:+ start:3256 stop:3564 length:309 start_codon:yes stop_codon:yes gene_type:complete
MKQDQLTAIVFRDGDAPLRIVVTGNRFCRTLRELVKVGPRGTTAAEMASWALRLAHYVHILKRNYGFHIDMKREPNSDGIGWHGRYFLRDRVQIVGPEREAA